MIGHPAFLAGLPSLIASQPSNLLASKPSRLHRFMKLKKQIAKWLLIGLLLFLAYAVFVEPFWVRTKVVEVDDANFVDFFKQYKTILISDIHVSRLGIREKILLNKIKKISPDIIFITGDFVSWAGDYEKAFEFIAKLKSKVGIWAVLGDSDYQNSR